MTKPPVWAISSEQAWRNATRRTLKQAGYPAKFPLHADDRFFVIGSCLARQIEMSLRIRGLTVLSTMPAYPRSECDAGAEPFNKYSLWSILQEIAWATGSAKFPIDSFIEEEPSRWSDLQLSGGVRPVSRERILEWRADAGRYFARIAQADVVVIDFCSLDDWYDTTLGLALNTGPSRRAMRREPDRFAYCLRTVEELCAGIRDLRRVLNAFGHPVRLILTVNPMRLEATFRASDTDAVASLFRSVGRVACEVVAAECNDVEYAPTLEAFSAMPRTEVFEADDIHVRQDVLDGEIALLLRAHGIDRAASEPDFDESAYLSANPDVAVRVRAAKIQSGYHHWIAEGRAAGRSLRLEALRLDGPLDSRSMRARIAASVPARVSIAEEFSLYPRVTNDGDRILVTDGTFPVYVCYRWFDASGATLDEPSIHTRFDDPLMPAGSVTMRADIRAPHLAGEYTLALTLLQSNVAWFDDIDEFNGIRVPVRVEAASVRAEDPSIDVVATDVR